MGKGKPLSCSLSLFHCPCPANLQTKDFTNFDQALPALVHLRPQQALRQRCKRIISYRMDLGVSNKKSQSLFQFSIWTYTKQSYISAELTSKCLTWKSKPFLSSSLKLFVLFLILSACVFYVWAIGNQNYFMWNWQISCLRRQSLFIYR